MPACIHQQITPTKVCKIMKTALVMDTLTIQEPKWRLDRRDSGHLFWRQDSENSRVKFRCDVDVLEFHRQDYEREITYLDYHEEGGTHPIVMGVTCVVCLAVTVLLPYFIIS